MLESKFYIKDAKPKGCIFLTDLCHRFGWCGTTTKIVTGDYNDQDHQTTVEPDRHWGVCQEICHSKEHKVQPPACVSFTVSHREGPYKDPPLSLLVESGYYR